MINTILGILSGPGALYGLNDRMTCRILAREKLRIPLRGGGYVASNGTREKGGGGGKKESARAFALVTLSSAVPGTLFEDVFKVGTQALE